MERVDQDVLKNIMREQYKQRNKITVFKLPCCGNNKQLTRTGDQVVICGDCAREFYLIWSKVGKHKYQEITPNK